MYLTLDVDMFKKLPLECHGTRYWDAGAQAGCIKTNFLMACGLLDPPTMKEADVDRTAVRLCAALPKEVRIALHGAECSHINAICRHALVDASREELLASLAALPGLVTLKEAPRA